MLCHTEKIAPAMPPAAVKYMRASVEARPEFCMPTSIDIARTCAFVMPAFLAARYPSVMPPRLWRMTTQRMMRPLSRIVRPERDTTHPTVKMMTRAESIGVIFVTFETAFGKKILRRTPERRGRSTISMMEIIMDVKLTP